MNPIVSDSSPSIYHIIIQHSDKVSWRLSLVTTPATITIIIEILSFHHNVMESMKIRPPSVPIRKVMYTHKRCRNPFHPSPNPPPFARRKGPAPLSKCSLGCHRMPGIRYSIGTYSMFCMSLFEKVLRRNGADRRAWFWCPPRRRYYLVPIELIGDATYQLRSNSNTAVPFQEILSNRLYVPALVGVGFAEGYFRAVAAWASGSSGDCRDQCSRDVLFEEHCR